MSPRDDRAQDQRIPERWGGEGDGEAFPCDQRLIRFEPRSRQVHIDDASGVTAAAGLDMDIGRRWFVNIDARWIDLNSTLQLNGRGRERFVIDPYLFGLSIGRRLR